MLTPRTRARIARLHRWLALALAPVILLIILSGAVLAFRPILHPDGERHPRASRHADIGRILALVTRAEAAGPVDFAGFADAEHRTFMLAGPKGAAAYDLATGAAVPMPAPPGDEPSGIFDVALRVHKELWVGAGALVTIASLAMIFLVIAGPLLARPGRGIGPLGQHVRFGWFLWPLVALLPLSLVMMKLHLPVLNNPSAARAPMSRLMRDAARVGDLSSLDGMQRLPGGRAFVVLENASGPTRYVFADGRLRTMDSRMSAIGRELHEGTWAGRRSGFVNLAAAAAMLWMLGSGVLSFARRRARRRVSAAVAA